MKRSPTLFAPSKQMLHKSHYTITWKFTQRSHLSMLPLQKQCQLAADRLQYNVSVPHPKLCLKNTGNIELGAAPLVQYYLVFSYGPSLGYGTLIQFWQKLSCQKLFLNQATLASLVNEQVVLTLFLKIVNKLSKQSYSLFDWNPLAQIFTSCFSQQYILRLKPSLGFYQNKEGLCRKIIL